MKQRESHYFIFSSLQLIDKWLCYVSTVIILRQFIIDIEQKLLGMVYS